MRNIKNIEEKIKEQVVNDYVTNKKSQSFCIKKYHLTQSQIKNILKEKGIHIRNQAEAAMISNANRAYQKKIDYFKTQSHNMAWIMGFIASDGTIRLKNNEIKIGLAAKDKEILEKIKDEIGIGNKIVEYTTSNGFDCVSLTWTCAEHKQDLAEYGIIPKKTFKLSPPYKLNKEYWIDYIRGYFDGDGSINLLSNGSLRWQVCSATKEILNFILDCLDSDYGIKKVAIQETERVSPLYCIQYSTESTRKIFNILYSKNSLFLKRKHDYFSEAIKLMK